MAKFFFVLSLFAVASAFNVAAPLAAHIKITPTLAKQRTQKLGALKLPLHRKNQTRNVSSGKSQGIVGALRNDVSGYSIPLLIGTPAQIVEVQFDTGSSELWVNPSCSAAYYPPGCMANGNYTPSVSATSVNLGTSFSISYGIGSVSGQYYKDTVRIGTATIAGTQFGSGVASEFLMQGILGAGLGNGFLTMSYNSVIDQLWTQGIIPSRAFSVDLASIDVAQGSVIFGGIDTMKYSGTLKKLPIIPYQLAPDHYPRYWIKLNSVGITPPGAASTTTLTSIGSVITVIPDSGSTFCYIPLPLFNAIIAFFPGAVSSQGAYVVPCAFKDQPGTFQFTFGGTTINVPYHEFIWFDGAQCWFAAVPSGVPYILGDSFMRSAYVVFDQENFNVHIAQAANCGTNVVAIMTGVNAVPSITGGCTPPQSSSSSMPQSLPSSKTHSRSSTNRPTSRPTNASKISSKAKSISSPPPNLVAKSVSSSPLNLVAKSITSSPPNLVAKSITSSPPNLVAKSITSSPPNLVAKITSSLPNLATKVTSKSSTRTSKSVSSVASLVSNTTSTPHSARPSFANTTTSSSRTTMPTPLKAGTSIILALKSQPSSSSCAVVTTVYSTTIYATVTSFVSNATHGTCTAVGQMW